MIHSHEDRMLADPRLRRRFWRKVKKRGPEDCWLWTGARDRHGYGVIAIAVGDGRYRNRPAHRVAYELLRGPLPPRVLLLSSCSAPHCVNPGHHFPGNAPDVDGVTALQKPRWSMTAFQRYEIRRIWTHKRGTTLQIAQRLDLTVRQVRRARATERWGRSL